MMFIIEAFSWGKDLLVPVIQTRKEADLQAARVTMDQLWANAQCFHARVTSRMNGAQHHLHHMKSRPTSDREIHLCFDRVDGLNGSMNVLRASDFPEAVPTAQFRLPATSFFGQFLGGKPYLLGRSPGLANFEICLSVAAQRSNDMEALIPMGEDWYYLSEVDVNGGQALLSFQSTAWLPSSSHS
jgi:hypothetical protein